LSLFPVEAYGLVVMTMFVPPDRCGKAEDSPCGRRRARRNARRDVVIAARNVSGINACGDFVASGQCHCCAPNRRLNDPRQPTCKSSSANRMSVRVYFHRFARKFIFDVLPGALASLVGALFFAQQWTQAPMRTEVARVTAQNEQIVTMMREEQTLMRAVLEREHEAQRQPLAVKDPKDKVETTVPARRRVEPAREANRAVAASVAPSPPPAVKPAAEPQAATLESGPLTAPEPDEGVITRIVSVVAALTHRTVEASGVRAVAGFVPSVPVITDKFDAWPSGHVLDAKR
jgi:hypothetical protein